MAVSFNNIAHHRENILKDSIFVFALYEKQYLLCQVSVNKPRSLSIIPSFESLTQTFATRRPRVIERAMTNISKPNCVNVCIRVCKRDDSIDFMMREGKENGS